MTSRLPAAAAEPTGPLTLLLGCPQCGAPFSVDDDAVACTCSHCSSLLVLARPGQEEFFVAPGQVFGPEDVRTTVLLYRVRSYRGELASRYGLEDPEAGRMDEGFLEAQLKKVEGRLRREVRVVEAYCFHAPYWHVSGMIVQALLGRRRDGPKEVAVRAFTVEQTSPAYDGHRANLRDRGLRLARAKVRPLTRADVREHAAFLPWQPAAPEALREIRRWVARDIDPDIESVTKQSGFTFARRALVYRPYWLARVFTDQGQSWVLVDGGFGTIAGYPGEMEAREILALPVPNPEGAESREIRVLVRASRCPECGVEERVDPRSRVVVCPNCHRALAAGEMGMVVLGCDHASRGHEVLDGSYVPFWTFTFRIEVPGVGAFERLEGYADALFPRALPRGFHPSGDRLWVPAVRLLGTEIGDSVFKRLGESIHALPPEVHDGKVPLGRKAAFWPATLSEPEAREAAPFLLHAIHGKTSAARLNTLILKKTVARAKLSLSSPRLVLVPFDRVGEELEMSGTRVRLPLLLLSGGPELDAMKATVYQPKPRPSP